MWWCLRCLRLVLERRASGGWVGGWVGGGAWGGREWGGAEL